MLGVLAMKKRWQNKRKAEGKPFDRPNIIMNSAVQVCWEKAARYFDVEEKVCSLPYFCAKLCGEEKVANSGCSTFTALKTDGSLILRNVSIWSTRIPSVSAPLLAQPTRANMRMSRLSMTFSLNAISILGSTVIEPNFLK